MSMPSSSDRTPSHGVPEWIAGAEPPVPEAFFPHLAEVAEGADPSSPGELTDAAVEALRRALECRERAGAFDLLAADALVTYACEAALSDPDPTRRLAAVLEGIVRLAEGTDGTGPVESGGGAPPTGAPTVPPPATGPGGPGAA